MAADWRRSPRFVSESQGTSRLRLRKAALDLVNINKKLVCEIKSKNFFGLDFRPSTAPVVSAVQLAQLVPEKFGRG